ncbi:MAG: hypothetical protein JSW64_12070 [Candidatus Zixiibacteriota bacterium]|nr:MAG: hypothetical protein JSW64_12070 [candidate division Zixibacteria bacterium]
MICLLICFLIPGCSDDNAVRNQYQANPLSSIEPGANDPGELTFSIVPKYSYIRSYPGGGGIFIVRLLNTGIFMGDVNLYLRADPSLNASLDRNTLNSKYNIAEITIQPSESVELGTYEIDLYAVYGVSPSHTGKYVKITLEVEVMQWGPTNPSNVISKMDDFVEWLETEHPELGNFSNRIWFPYMTYPQIWIVEHWTFLDEDWEFRLCYHVTIPPYDWSKILLRRRGQWDPVLAAQRESDGTIFEIPISEYPIMYGY